jgi:hypothetical protein
MQTCQNLIFRTIPALPSAKPRMVNDWLQSGGRRQILPGSFCRPAPGYPAKANGASAAKLCFNSIFGLGMVSAV